MNRAIRKAAMFGVFMAILAAVPMAKAQTSQTLPLVLPAGGPRDSLVFIINNSPRAGTVRIHAIDDTGDRRGPITLSIDANGGARFHSRDLEQGNPARLSAGVGDGSGNWRLELDSSLNFGALAYIRTSDGFLTGMYDKVPATAGTHHVVFFNPASNLSKQSRLRLINPGTTGAEVTISARDEAGTCAPGGSITLTLPAGDSRILSSSDLESGGSGFSGSFGDGTGKWRLFVSSSTPIEVMSLLSSASGHLSNLSSVFSVPFDSSTDTCRQNTTPPPPTRRYGAIATGFNGSRCSDGWRFGATRNRPDSDTATSNAIALCDSIRPTEGRSCSARVWFTACGSVAYSPLTLEGGCLLIGSFGATREEAEQAALTRCRSGGDTFGCRIATTRNHGNLTVCNDSSAIRDRAYSIDGYSSFADMGNMTDE